ncbi:MAG: zinc ribbon domain-containing protein [Gammaproteobacteria bacterium]|nr:zinc ribbon domain-containing protein [Gammaproteobacteria bacterium]MCH9717025.1 zinc ribbon domain-containing protein [Gammaproteobacteria bacterium]MCH9763821.1 zinc ribbon domain-containing protein [Gammaproteobacteria bacterium]
MPIYEYQCNACQHTFDKLQKMSDEPIKQCPECGQNTVDKLVSAAAFQLKGTGWYVTDFKDKPKKEADKSDKNETTTEKKPKEAKKTAGSKD